MFYAILVMQVFTNFIDSIFLDLAFIVEIRPIHYHLIEHLSMKIILNLSGQLLLYKVTSQSMVTLRTQKTKNG